MEAIMLLKGKKSKRKKKAPKRPFLNTND